MSKWLPMILFAAFTILAAGCELLPPRQDPAQQARQEYVRAITGLSPVLEALTVRTEAGKFSAAEAQQLKACKEEAIAHLQEMRTACVAGNVEVFKRERQLYEPLFARLKAAAEAKGGE